jgi:hypothetical protein
MRHRVRLLPVLALAGLFLVVGEARALDFKVPSKLIGRLLGKKTEEAGKPGTGARRAVPGKPGVEASEPVTPAAAAADSAALQALDDILLSPEPYNYSDPGRRDPFVSLVAEDYLEEHQDEKTQISDYAVVGILWGENDRFALVEDMDGASMILREGDRLGRYSVTRIEPGAVLFYGTEYGVGQTERLLLKERKGNPNGRQSR